MRHLIVGLGVMILSANSQADLYGLTTARTADVLSEPQMTLEGGISLEGDLTTIGGQINFKASPNMLIYGTIANVDPEYGDAEVGFGGGVIYQIEQTAFSNIDTAVKGSYHQVELGGGALANDLSDFGVELLISPAGVGDANGMKLFGMLGVHRRGEDSDLGSDSATEVSFGGGAITAVGAGEAYVVVEHIDQLFFGFGYRFALGQ